MSSCYMPGLEAMENTVNFPVIPEFTERMEGGGSPWKGPAGPIPLTQPDGKLRVPLSYVLNLPSYESRRKGGGDLLTQC